MLSKNILFCIYFVCSSTIIRFLVIIVWSHSKYICQQHSTTAFYVAGEIVPQLTGELMNKDYSFFLLINHFDNYFVRIKSASEVIFFMRTQTRSADSEEKNIAEGLSDPCSILQHNTTNPGLKALPLNYSAQSTDTDTPSKVVSVHF